MSSLVISGDTSGSITLSAPAVAGTNTITLPASTGTVLTTGSPQSGGVIQVVNATYGTNTSTTSGSYAATGLTASITPKFSTSKILVIASMAGTGCNAASSNPSYQIYKNGSFLAYWDNIVGTGSVNGNTTTSISYLDSPATTSSTTYAIYWARIGSGTAYLNNYQTAIGQTVSTITLMEVAA
jgi:hypothetical protein